LVVGRTVIEGEIKMSIPMLTEATIRSGASSESFSRGRDYYDRGAVANLTLRDDMIEGTVEGSQYTPYRVRVTFDQGGIAAATCTCPYGLGGWCKHIVAVLLAALHNTSEIERRPSLETLLAGLDRTQLQTLLLSLAERDPDMADAIERQVVLLRLANAAPSST